MNFSVVIPTLNEQAFLPACIDSIKRLDAGVEIIVADGGSTDGTDLIAGSKDARLCRSQRGRGLQCNAGASIATGDVLVFLHADTMLPENAFARLTHIFNDRRVQFGTFRITFDVDHWFLRFLSFISVFDLGLFRFGDQCFVARKSFFHSLGGFRNWTVFEDMEFYRRAGKKTRTIRFPMAVTTSARRFVQNGIIRQQVKNTWLTVLYLLGISPAKLAVKYEQGNPHFENDKIPSIEMSKRHHYAKCDRIYKRSEYLNLPGGAEQWTSL
jgi:rSAM/selenodomain-associated transferase 2